GNSSDAFILLKAKQLAVPINMIPLVFVVMNVVYALAAYPAGRLSDQVGRKSLLFASFCLYALVYVGLALSGQPWQFWILILCYGAYLGMSQGVLMALVADQVSSEVRGTAFGAINLSMGLAQLPASLLAGWLWQSFSPAASFGAGAAFALLSAVML